MPNLAFTAVPGSSDLLSRSRQPVYLQLATIFRRQIESGEWRQGARIPSLEQLCREFGVARMTMHHALSLLDEEGLLTREQRPFALGEVFIEASVFARKPEAFRHGPTVPVPDPFPQLKVTAARQRLSIIAAGAAPIYVPPRPASTPGAQS